MSRWALIADSSSDANLLSHMEDRIVQALDPVPRTTAPHDRRREVSAA